MFVGANQFISCQWRQTVIVDAVGLAGDKRRLLAGQKHHQRGHFMRLREPAHRLAGHKSLVGLDPRPGRQPLLNPVSA